MEKAALLKDLILGLDTCTRWLNLALLDWEGHLVAGTQEEVVTHTTRLVPALDALFLSAGRSRGDLCAVGVVLGPGSFTGLRVGIAAAEGLSKGLGVPAFGLDSLAALAEAATGEGTGLALLDARRKQVYAGSFVREGDAVYSASLPVAIGPEEVLARMPGPSWAAGDGVTLVEGWPEGCILSAGIPNLAVSAARNALRALRDGRSPGVLTPLYVRAPDIREPGGG